MNVPRHNARSQRHPVQLLLIKNRLENELIENINTFKGQFYILSLTQILENLVVCLKKRWRYIGEEAEN